jgi:hypothetical protein
MLLLLLQISVLLTAPAAALEAIQGSRGPSVYATALKGRAETRGELMCAREVAPIRF